MKTIYNILLITAFGILNNAGINAQQEFTKKIVKEYEANSQTTLQVDNKYGQIQFENWDKPSVKIEITIKVEHNDNVKAQKLLEMLNVDFSETENTIKAITNIEDGFGTSNYWHSISGKRFSINFLINAPKNINLNLTNKYGNIFVNELDGLLTLDLKYGNLNINKLNRGDANELNSIVINYGNALIDQCSWLKVNAAYSNDLSINSGKALVLVTKYSKIHIDKASSLVAESAYDGYKLGTLTNFVLEGKYGQYKIQSITKKIDSEIKYGGLEVTSIPESFISIKSVSAYSNVKLGISKNSSFKIDGYAKFGNIDIPDGGKISKTKTNTSVTIIGSVGNNPVSTVKIESSYGNVEMD